MRFLQNSPGTSNRDVELAKYLLLRRKREILGRVYQMDYRIQRLTSFERLPQHSPVPNVDLHARDNVRNWPSVEKDQVVFVSQRPADGTPHHACRARYEYTHSISPVIALYSICLLRRNPCPRGY